MLVGIESNASRSAIVREARSKLSWVVDAKARCIMACRDFLRTGMEKTLSEIQYDGIKLKTQWSNDEPIYFVEDRDRRAIDDAGRSGL